MSITGAEASVRRTKARARGPEAVRRALIAATEQTMGERPPGEVTVREIAAVAGVNHGLVHHYFDSKEALLGATMEHVEAEFADALADIEDAAQAVGAFFDEVCARPTYPRLLAWLLLEGVDPTDYVGRFPLVSRLVDLIRRDTSLTEARHRVQALLAFAAGWTTTHEFMADAAGLTTRQRATSPSTGRTAAVLIATGSTG